MSEFCKKCSKEYDFPHEYTSHVEICEGCGKEFTDKNYFIDKVAKFFRWLFESLF